MAVVVDATNAPWVHASGTTAEVLGQLKADHISLSSLAQIWYNGTNTSAVYRRGA